MPPHDYVLYHANCPDGFGAAYAAWRALGDDATYIPVQYGQEPPEMEEMSNIYIVDFSYPRETLLRIGQEHNFVIVIDHHASAEKELVGISKEMSSIRCKFDMEHSGAVLSWNFFNRLPMQRDEPVPLLLEYVEDRDLWKWRLSHSKEVSLALSMIPKTFQHWDNLCSRGFDGIQALIDTGSHLLEYQSKLVQDQCRAAVLRTLCGHVVPVVNATTLFSECGDYLCQHYEGAEFAAYYMDRADNMRQWGLRSRGGFDCTTVAVKMGGGGHPGAAGFVTELGWLPPLAIRARFKGK